ncbi:MULTISPECIES: hypothetical protein [Luteibacter]|uniref:Uncharacterized protein n=1 Tax=Luteibacter yeojuensis TaxID=345309 RepID=A0A7X5TPG0_9GAMM|nr:MULTISPECIES: hypothetical protein [Luteibacter]KAF1008939.1 MAG: hypothetical protein GAK28_00571 [Luteibacter sp.]NID15020.1 hypothetical protein [Luteibacter yeojuensis]
MDKRNPILIGQAEVIDLVQPQVRTMLATDGFYIGTDTEHPDFEVPLVVINGKVYGMTVDNELDPERFKDSLLLAGPFRGLQEVPQDESNG